MSENLFSYGTLQRDDVQLALFGRLLNGTKDVLNDYQITSIEITDESFLAKGEDKIQRTLVPSKNDSVEGTVFEISEEELLLSDTYEPDNYQRVKVILQSGTETWIYLAGGKKG
jgi:gamma-glutamylcyclotransferase (GGCT)/AIG2-like uncharacterized protein YtfP